MDESENTNTPGNTTAGNPATTIDPSKIDPNTKAYIDATSNAIIGSIKAYIDQSNTDLIKMLNERLDSCINQQQRPEPQISTTNLNNNSTMDLNQHTTIHQSHNNPVIQDALGSIN